MVYLVVAVAFPNRSAANKMQFMWRLAAWVTCALAFAAHIGLEHLRLRNSPRGTALHASLSVALGAFGLAVQQPIGQCTTALASA